MAKCSLLVSHMALASRHCLCKAGSAGHCKHTRLSRSQGNIQAHCTWQPMSPAAHSNLSFHLEKGA